MERPKPKGSYAETRKKQAEFEEKVREEDDWQEAVEETVRGEGPEEEPDDPAFSGL